MATEITPEMRQAIEASHGGPVEIVDPAKNKHYLLVDAQEFARMKAALEADDWDPRTMYPVMAKVMKDDWDDPQMDSYDRMP